MNSKTFTLIIIFININNCEINIKETTNKIKTILNSYQVLRARRSLVNQSRYTDNVLNFFVETERFSEFMKYLDVTSCSEGGKGQNDSTYVKRHIHHGLIFDFNVSDTHWEEYKEAFDKKYLLPHREMAAHSQWRNNLQHVAEHNKQFLAGTQSYSLHLNHFADLHVEDYIKYFLKHINAPTLRDPSEDIYKTTYHRIKHSIVPRRVDWREQGFRPRREQQLKCGACYAFAVTHALQAQLYKKHKDWQELSPQQIVDCSAKDGNYACDGGSLRGALRYVTREGLLLERHYPYRGRRGICKDFKLLPRVRPRRWAMLPAHNEAAMEKALATIGPLAVAVNASPRTFQLYRSGIYDDPFCTPFKLNHAMLLVGYSPQYWLLLNWWGRQWGEDGYIRTLIEKSTRRQWQTKPIFRIRRGLNRCGVANMAAYVEL